MAESPEIPEAKDPFEKKIAFSIAIIAVALAIIGAKGDHAKTEAIIKTNHASDKWSYFQSKSVKQQLTKLESHLITLTAAASPDAAKQIEAVKTEGERYEKEKEEIKKEAEELQEEATKELTLHGKFHIAEMLLQLGVVLSSIAILARQHVAWLASLTLATAGVIIALIAWF